MLSTKTTSTVNFKPLLNLDMSPVLNSAAEIVRKNIRKRFKDGADLQGSALTKLTTATIADKKRKGYKSPPLPLTARGKLAMNQIIARATKAIQKAIVYINPSGANYNGTPADEIYGFHHEGMGYNPVRRTFGIADEPDRKEIADYYHRFIRRIVSNLGKA